MMTSCLLTVLAMGAATALQEVELGREGRGRRDTAFYRSGAAVAAQVPVFTIPPFSSSSVVVMLR